MTAFRRHHLMLGAALPVIAFFSALPAAAEPVSSSPPTTGSCQFRESVCSGLGAPGAVGPRTQQPEEAGTTARAKSNSRNGPTLYERRRTELDYEVQGTRLFSHGDFCIDPATQQRGVGYIEQIVNRATGEVVSSREGCKVRPGPRVPTAPAVAPQLPAPQEIWEHVPLPRPDWGLNPSANGLTGLETWLWDPNGGAPVSATVTLDGFTATATARPVRWEWRMWERGDTPNVNPPPRVVSTSPGSPERPAGKYMYETNGEYTVTRTVVWAGSYTLAGPGVSETVDLGTTTTSSSRRYPVIAVRGARVG